MRELQTEKNSLTNENCAKSNSPLKIIHLNQSMIILVFLTFAFLFKEDMAVCEYIWILRFMAGIFSNFSIFS